MAKYDFLIVGAGLFGATCARLLTDKGYKCLIIEKRAIVGGNCATERKNDIDIHLYGPHVFHTDDEEVWNFVNKYSKFIDYKHEVLSYSDGKLYHLPINMNTFNEILGTNSPMEAVKKVNDEISRFNVEISTNLEELAINSCGFSVYNKLIKPYSEKLWGVECTKINPMTLAKFPIRFIYDNSYFNEKYQGIPEDGYTKLVENIIGEDIDILLKTDYLQGREKYDKLASYVIFCGPIDKFCNYIYGPLKWRSLRFEFSDESNRGNNIYGTPVINIPDSNDDMIRITEHKWFTKDRVNTSDDFNSHTYISYEYPENWTPEKECFYPINDGESENILDKYISFTKENFPNFVFGGRQGTYRALSMDETIRLALNLCNIL